MSHRARARRGASVDLTTYSPMQPQISEVSIFAFTSGLGVDKTRSTPCFLEIKLYRYMAVSVHFCNALGCLRATAAECSGP